MVDIGTLGGDLSFARAINEEGIVVGEARNSRGDFRAFCWSNGTMTDLGTLGGNWARALAVNNSGVIVGVSSTSTSKTGRAFKFLHNRMTDLAPNEANSSEATSINSSGVIAGTVDIQGVPIGCYWSSQAIHNLAENNATNVYGISPNNEIIGTIVAAGHTSETPQAFIWRPRRISILPLPKSTHSSTATAINKDGTTVGWIDDEVPMIPTIPSKGNKPCKWTFGNKPQFQQLSVSIGEANAINDRGVVVGEIDVTNGRSHAALWSMGKEIDLNNVIPSYEHWLLEQATGINNKGQIIGWGMHNGHRHAFLMTPK